ncbi:fatty-acid-binding protein 1 [Canna indica]|uniref:Chalcone--flavanone isomerase n=1 Tax=Canna indica TaxID=4628 RepID=A0AAQ3QDZ9_9LILI|nr:fatty-acid-binding protein 1 [Canna indica]
MGSLRFPFPLPQQSKPSYKRSLCAAAVAVAAVGAGAGLAIAISLKHQRPITSPSSDIIERPCSAASSSRLLASSLSANGTPPPDKFVHSVSGMVFPLVVNGGRRLIGVGMRLKYQKRYLLFENRRNDIYYTFGVYADSSDIKRLRDKYSKYSATELKENKEFITDIVDEDLRMTISFQVVHNVLKTGTLRGEFAKNVGKRLKMISGSDDKELLQSFTSLFRDEYTLQKGSTVDLAREHNHILQIRIDGKEVGRFKSKLLCKSVFDLYIGPEAEYDKEAQKEFQLKLASMLQDKSDG